MITFLMGISLAGQVTMFILAFILIVSFLTAACMSDSTVVEIGGMLIALACSLECIITAGIWIGFWG